MRRLPAREGGNDYEEESTREIIDPAQGLGLDDSSHKLGFTHDPAIGKFSSSGNKPANRQNSRVDRVLVCETLDTLTQISSKISVESVSATLGGARRQNSIPNR